MEFKMIELVYKFNIPFPWDSISMGKTAPPLTLLLHFDLSVGICEWLRVAFRGYEEYFGYSWEYITLIMLNKYAFEYSSQDDWLNVMAMGIKRGLVGIF